MDEREIAARIAEEAGAKRTVAEKRAAVRTLATRHLDWPIRRLMREAQVSWCLAIAVLKELGDQRVQ